MTLVLCNPGYQPGVFKKAWKMLIFISMTCLYKMNKYVILNRGLYRWDAPRKVVIRGLINYELQDLLHFSTAQEVEIPDRDT